MLNLRYYMLVSKMVRIISIKLSVEGRRVNQWSNVSNTQTHPIKIDRIIFTLTM
jgi:hypothetical protein